MPKEKCWIGPIADKDDFHGPIADEFVDGVTQMGPWAIMNPYNHKKYGRGIGLGRGQRYRKQLDGRWLKVEG